MKIKKIMFIVLLIITLIIINAINYSYVINKDLSNSCFRLHILANSDSIEDQNLKLKVRDNVLNYLNTSLNTSTASKESVKDFLLANSDSIQTIACNTIKSEGFNYPVNIDFGTFNFPTKNYGNISLPAGNYDGLKINIGAATGHNWWCVMFPPLCFVDINSGIIDENSESQIKQNLSSEEYAIINTQNQSSPIKLKFKIIEFINSLN